MPVHVPPKNAWNGLVNGDTSNVAWPLHLPHAQFVKLYIIFEFTRWCSWIYTHFIWKTKCYMPSIRAWNMLHGCIELFFKNSTYFYLYYIHLDSHLDAQDTDWIGTKPTNAQYYQMSHDAAFHELKIRLDRTLLLLSFSSTASLQISFHFKLCIIFIYISEAILKNISNYSNMKNFVMAREGTG